MADTNRLPIGTTIVQPGPEVAPSNPDDEFAALSAFIPIQFPESRLNPVANRFDAAIAVVSDLDIIKTGAMFGIDNYTPQLATAVPGMRVTKSGRTTGVTTGVVRAINVDRVQVNYGTRTSPRIATFNDTIQIAGDDGPFSAPGDSGSVILERDTGRPVAVMLLRELTLAVILFVIVANSAFGVVAGYLYWKWGLESAMIAHMLGHVLLAVASYSGAYF